MQTSRTALIFTFALCLAAPAAHAQQTASSTAPAADAQQTTSSAAPAGDAQQTASSPEDQRAALNRQQAEMAQHQLEENAARQQAYEKAVKANAEKVQQEQASYEAEKARREQEYKETMARWKADVAACKAGDVSRCAKEK